MTRHPALVLAAVCAAVLLPFPASATGAPPPCTSTDVAGGEWPSYGHDAANTRSQPLETALPTSAAAALAPAWVFSTEAQGDSGVLQSTPVVSAGCVFVGSSTGRLYALDAASGSVVWSHRVEAVSTGQGGALV